MLTSRRMVALAMALPLTLGIIAAGAGRSSRPGTGHPQAATRDKSGNDIVPATEPAGARPPLQPIPPARGAITDEQIDQAIRRGAAFLLSRFSSRKYVLFDTADLTMPSLTETKGPTIATGMDGLAVYALIQCGLATKDPRLAPNSRIINNMLDALKELPAERGYVTYARAIRATALSLLHRPQDMQAIKKDVRFLVQFNSGAYTYDAAGGTIWDNSNSQYGLLGVWSAADVGIEVPTEYWERCREHWVDCQLSDGQWPYGPQEPGPRSTMTAAGIVSLIACHDWLDPIKFHGDVGRDPFPSPLRRGLQWWEADDNYLLKSTSGRANYGYVLFGIERVGLATGFKFFGSHEWYPELAAGVLSRQMKNGSWGGVINTAYVLAFLARGRHPVMFNKLRFERSSPGQNGRAEEHYVNRFWANRPRDAANLARWAGRELERPLNWQVVPLERDWTDWTDSPVLYLASHHALSFSDRDCDKLREFILNGGMIFTQADGDSPAFTRWVGELSRRLFPQYELQEVPASHPLYSVSYQLHGRPSLKMVTNGSRILLLHSPTDVSRWWHTRDDKLHPDYFRLGLNVFLYAGGKRDWRNKLQVAYVPEPTRAPTWVTRVLRLSYPGNWDPEPAAWRRFGRLFQKATGYGVDVQSCRWADLTPGAAPIAHLTGAAAYEPTAREQAAMRRFVEAGGVLLIDPCGGSGPFARTIRAAIVKAFPGHDLQPVPLSHPLLNRSAPGMADLRKPLVRAYVTEKIGVHYGGFEILSAGRGHVIFSELDVTSGLLGTDTWGIWGYRASYAQEFLQNVLLWIADIQNDNNTAPRRGPATVPSPADSSDRRSNPRSTPAP